MQNMFKMTSLVIGLVFANGILAQDLAPRLRIPDLKQPVRAVSLPIPVKSGERLSHIRVTRTRGVIDVRDGDSSAAISHTMANRGKTDVDVKAAIGGVAPKSLKLKSRAQSTVNLQSPIEVKKGKKALNSMRFAPQLLVNGSPLVEPVSDYSLDVILPADARKLVKSNKPLEPIGKKDGRLAYQWSGRGEYVTPLQVWWTTSATDLSIGKDVKADWKNHTVTVSLKVKNNGSGVADDITLKEDFPIQEYSGISRGSDGTFTEYRGRVNDRRLLWEYTLPKLAAGQEATIKYMLKMRPGLSIAGLYETRALEDGEPVAVSDTVKIARARR